MKSLDDPARTNAPAVCGLLPPALRRDLTDLNQQYLDLGLTEGLRHDPRFDWSEPVRHCLLVADPAVRARIAAAPFALFGLVLPACAAPVSAPRVEDGRGGRGAAPDSARCESFAHQAVFFARRLADGEPMVLQLVLGLSQQAQRWLGECRPAQLAELAGSAHVIRPRWRLHARFWEMLAATARRGSPGALQWAHCVGLSLLGAADADAAAPPPRRRPQR